MTLKKLEDWPIKDLQMDPFNVWSHYDAKTKLYVPNKNGHKQHFMPGLKSFGSGEHHVLMRNRCRFF